METEQIDFLADMYAGSKMTAYYKDDDGKLQPILRIQMNFMDKDAEIGEPVAWFSDGTCIALWNTEASRIIVNHVGTIF